MWNRIKEWWRARRQPKIWAVYDARTGTWHKMVTYRCPVPLVIRDTQLRGPFRTETDCEDFCDRVNTAWAKDGGVPLYDQELLKKLRRRT